MTEQELILAILLLFVGNMFMSLWLAFTFGKVVNKWISIVVIWCLPVLGLLYCFWRYYLGEKKLPRNPDYNTDGVSGKSDKNIWRGR